MAGNKQDVVLGPWAGGLNTRDDDLNLEEDQLTEATNIVIQPDGSIKLRPGFYSLDTFSETLQLVRVQVPSNQFNPVGVVFNTATSKFSLRSLNILTGVWTTMFGSAVWDSDVTIIKNPVSSGYHFIQHNTTNTWSSPVPNMLHASSVLSGPVTTGLTMDKHEVVYQGRLFSYLRGSYGRVVYSKATDFNTFTSPDGGFFDVSSPVKRMLVHNSNLYMVSMDNLYRFTFQLDPATDGYNTSIGTLRDGRDICEVEGRLFVLDSGALYEYVNGELLVLSDRVSSEFSGLNLSYVSKVGDYLILTSELNVAGSAVLVYNFRTDAWVRWATTTTYDWSKFLPRGKIFPIPLPVFSAADNAYDPTVSAHPEPGFISENGIYINLANKPLDLKSDGGRTPSDPSEWAYFEAKFRSKQYAFSSPVEWKVHYRTVVNNNRPFFVPGLSDASFVHRYTLTIRTSEDTYQTLEVDPNTEFGQVNFPRCRFLSAAWGYDFHYTTGYLPELSELGESLLISNIFTTVGVKAVTGKGKGEEIG